MVELISTESMQSYQNSSCLFCCCCISGQVEPKIMRNFKGPQVAKQSWQKRTKLEDSHFSILKLSYKTIEVKTVVLDWLYPKNVFGVKKKKEIGGKKRTTIKYIYVLKIYIYVSKKKFFHKVRYIDQ